MAPTEQRVTEILRRLDLSDRAQADELLSLVYGQLRRLAARQLGKERNDHTLQPTALVHETYLRMAAGEGGSGHAG